MKEHVRLSSESSRQTTVLEKILIVLVGIAATMGEHMNVYFSMASRMYVFISVALMVVLTYKVIIKKRNIRGVQIYFPLSFWVALVVIFLITLNRLSNIDSLDFGRMIEEFKPVLFMFFSVSLSSCFVNDRKLVDLFLWSYLLAFVIMIPFGRTGDYITAYRFCGTYANPNTYALDCIFAIFASLYLFRESKLKIIKWSLLAVCIITLLRTGSRGAMLSVILGLIIIFLFTKSAWNKLMFVLVGIVGAISILLFSFEDVNGIFVRLFESSYSENVRLEIWMEYLKNIPRFMWFGLEQEALSDIHHFTPHNAYLGVWVSYGIFAFIPYMCLWAKLLLKSFKVGKRDGADYGVCVLSALIFSYTMSGMTMENVGCRMTWIVIAVVIANVFTLLKKSYVRL